MAPKSSIRDDAPPAVDEPRALLADPARLPFLQVPDPHAAPRIRNRLEVIRRLSREVRHEKVVEGWIEGPIAEACDLRGLGRIMTDFYDDPSFVRDLIQFVLEVETTFAAAQVEVGADYIGIGDAAGCEVPRDTPDENLCAMRELARTHRNGARWLPTRGDRCGGGPVPK